MDKSMVIFLVVNLMDNFVKTLFVMDLDDDRRDSNEDRISFMADSDVKEISIL